MKLRICPGIDSAMEGLNKAWEGAAQEMYAASSQEGAPAKEGLKPIHLNAAAA